MKTLITLACLYVIFQTAGGIMKSEDLPAFVQAVGAIIALFVLITANVCAIHTLCQLY